MYQIKTLNKIAQCGLDAFPKSYTVSDGVENPDGILLRSFNMHEMEVPSNLKAVARAGAGTNNIPVEEYSKKGIVVFNTPGANANAVKELVIAALFLSSRKISDGIEWVKTLKGTEEVAKQVEKGKSAFVGPELRGKTLGVIGLGAIGVLVANAADSLGMHVIGYDPYLSVDAAWAIKKNIKKCTDLNELLGECDYITLHVPLTDETREMINQDSIAAAKDGIRIMNFSRGALVNDDHLAAALESGKVAAYVTDFPDEKVIGMKNVTAIPHLGASTPESEDNCAMMAADELIDYLENGNITNSVNFPQCSMPRSGKLRITIAHSNQHSMLSKFSGLIAEKSINIENMLNKSKKDMAYTIIDTNEEVSDADIESLRKMEGVLAVRVIK